MELIGSAGAISLLAAYFLITTGRIASSTLTYQGLNLFAAIALVAYGFHKAAWANVALNLVWMAVAIIGLLTWRRYRRKTSVKPKKV